jgi:hypothetical protein
MVNIFSRRQITKLPVLLLALPGSGCAFLALLVDEVLLGGVMRGVGLGGRALAGTVARVSTAAVARTAFAAEAGEALSVSTRAGARVGTIRYASRSQVRLADNAGSTLIRSAREGRTVRHIDGRGYTAGRSEIAAHDTIKHYDAEGRFAGYDKYTERSVLHYDAEGAYIGRSYLPSGTASVGGVAEICYLGIAYVLNAYAETLHYSDEKLTKMYKSMQSTQNACYDGDYEAACNDVKLQYSRFIDRISRLGSAH